MAQRGRAKSKRTKATAALDLSRQASFRYTVERPIGSAGAIDTVFATRHAIREYEDRKSALGRNQKFAHSIPFPVGFFLHAEASKSDTELHRVHTEFHCEERLGVSRGIWHRRSAIPASAELRVHSVQLRVRLACLATCWERNLRLSLLRPQQEAAPHRGGFVRRRPRPSMCAGPGQAIPPDRTGPNGT
jgi:hypothetical protein